MKKLQSVVRIGSKVQHNGKYGEQHKGQVGRVLAFGVTETAQVLWANRKATWVWKDTLDMLPADPSKTVQEAKELNDYMENLGR